jgi:hypothetical protein
MKFSDLQMTKIKNKIKLKGNKLQIYKIKRNENKLIKRDDMIKFCKKVLEDIKEKYSNGFISVSIKYPKHYYTMGMTNINDGYIKFFSMDDYNNFDEDPLQYSEFTINFMPYKSKSKKGGKDEHNDCLFNCIKKIIQTGKEKIKPDELKQYLKIDRDEPIDISDINKVESYLNKKLMTKSGNEYAIKISGDYSYNSKLQTNKIIDVILSDGHYKINEKVINKMSSFSHNERQLIVYDKQENVMYDGNDFLEFDESEFKSSLKNPHSAKFIFVSKYYIIKNIYKSNDYDIPIDEAFDKYFELATELKILDSKFNLLKSGLKDCALNFFYDKVKSIHPEDITQDEIKYIEDSSYGAITYWEPFKGQCYSVDINSCYPYVMQRNNHYFPIKQGEFKTITEFKNEYGLYRCKISNPNNKIVKLFSFNSSNHYTHIDIQQALDYGLSYELIQDGQPNFLYYSKDKLMNGAFLFKNYMDELYRLKSKSKMAKSLLNILWGALSEKNGKKYINNCHDELDLDDCNITDLEFTGQRINIKVINYGDNYYKTNYARIKPFVLSYGRNHCYKTFKEHEDDIVRVHTDGIYSKRKLDNHSETFGAVKEEKMINVNITGLNKGLGEKSK